MILVMNNPADGSRNHIDLGTGQSEWLIGRQNDCRIVLDSRKVSRKHARVFGGGDTWFVSDLGSTGGTRLNGHPVTDPVPFGHGDTLEIGGFTFVLTDSAAEPVPGPAQEVRPAEPPPPPPPQPDTFRNVNLLYTRELMTLKQRIHEHVLARLNLTEQSIQELANEEMLIKLEDALDQTLKELRHELPGEIPVETLRQALMDELAGFGPLSPLLRADDVDVRLAPWLDNFFLKDRCKDL